MKIYDLFGENRPSMEVTRRAVRYASGWVQALGPGGREAGRRDARDDGAAASPAPIFEEHRAAGRQARARHHHAATTS